MSIKEIFGRIGTLNWPIITLLITSVVIWYYIIKFLRSIF